MFFSTCCFVSKDKCHRFRGREHDDGSMLVHAGIKDGAKLSIAETTAYREHQAQAQAVQEQEALTQRQQAQAVQHVGKTTNLAVYAVLIISKAVRKGCAAKPLLLPVFVVLMVVCCLQDIREQQTMRLQVEVITTQVNQLAEQVR